MNILKKVKTFNYVLTKTEVFKYTCIVTGFLKKMFLQIDIRIPLSIIINASVGIFHPLSDFDGQTLGALDNLTLREMDYEEIN